MRIRFSKCIVFSNATLFSETPFRRLRAQILLRIFLVLTAPLLFQALVGFLSFLIQIVLGLAFGVIFERTRNLLADSVVHIALNALG